MKILIPGLLTFLLACNGGHLYKQYELPDNNVSGESSLVVNDSGQLILSWVESSSDGHLLQFSSYDGAAWQPATTIAAGNDWFVNWADFPSVVTNGSLRFSHFLQKSSPDTFAYDVMFTLSRDKGMTWDKPRKLHSDTTQTEHGFVAAIPFQDGFYVTWLDGRYSGSRGHDHGDEGGAMTIRAAFVGPEGTVQNDQEIDHKTCDCCQTDIALVNGRPLVMYRDRSDEEIRDMSYAYLEDSAWSKPALLHQDNWHIAGCPVNGPRLVSQGEKVAALWFTGADDDGTVKMSFSEDGGKTFGTPVVLESGKAMGRVDVILAGDQLYATWIGAQDSTHYLKAAKLDFNGKVLEQKNIIEIDHGRKTGFPRSAYYQDKLFVTYTDVTTQGIKVISTQL